MAATFGVASMANHVNADQVQSGDTLTSIAAKNHTDVATLQRLNNLGDHTVIYPGQDLKVSDTQTNSQTNNVQASNGTYVIQSGDTLAKIANQFNTTVANLQALNNMGSNTLIYAGQTLKISGTPVVKQTTTPVNQTVSQPVEKQPTMQQTAVKPAAQNTQNVQPVAQQTPQTNNNYQSNVSGSEAAAKNWIMQRESGGNYNARNGNYVGAFQLSSSYLNGDYSEANQNRVADQYVHERYGSWTNAQKHWETHNWY